MRLSVSVVDRRGLMAALLSAVVVLLAGCANESVDGEATTSTEPTTDASPTAETPPAPENTAVPENTARQVKRSSGRAELVLTDVRVGEHEGFDRIVLEFSGTGAPGWVVDYADEAVLDGSGEAVALDGDAFLDIYASGTTWPAPDYYDGPSRVEPQGGDVADVFVGGTFEGSTQVIAGIDGGPVPFRVFALTDPTRLVVDVDVP